MDNDCRTRRQNAANMNFERIDNRFEIAIDVEMIGFDVVDEQDFRNVMQMRLVGFIDFAHQKLRPWNANTRLALANRYRTQYMAHAMPQHR